MDLPLCGSAAMRHKAFKTRELNKNKTFLSSAVDTPGAAEPRGIIELCRGHCAMVYDRGDCLPYRLSVSGRFPVIVQL